MTSAARSSKATQFAEPSMPALACSLRLVLKQKCALAGAMASMVAVTVAAPKVSARRVVRRNKVPPLSVGVRDVPLHG